MAGGLRLMAGRGEMWRFWLAAAVILASALPPRVLAQQPHERFLSIGAGPVSSPAFAVAGLLANAISNPLGGRACGSGGSCGVPGLIATVQSSGGGADAIAGLIGGRFDTVLADSFTAARAFASEGPSGRRPFGELRALASLYVESLYVVIRRDDGPASLAALGGKAVALPEKGTVGHALALEVLAAHGLAARELKIESLSPDKRLAALAAGTADVAVFLAAEPPTGLAAQSETVPLDLLSLDPEIRDRLVSAQPGLVAVELPAEEMKDVGVRQTLGVALLWLGTDRLEDDLVKGSLVGLFHAETHAMLTAGHRLAGRIGLATATRGVALPFHPAAARYYVDAGALGGDSR